MLYSNKKVDNMILVDFSGILYQNIFGAISVVKPQINAETHKYNIKDFIHVTKALILSFLFEMQTQHSPTKGDIVICLDDNSKQNWRRSILPSYKSTRKLNRNDSEIPFDEVFSDIKIFLEQIRNNTPWKVISVPSAEADDVILCLSKHYASREPVLIVSSDKDMIQAQKHPNVTQYSPMLKAFITPESKGGDMNFWITEHVLLGDSSDEIPKITDCTKFSDNFYKYLKNNGYKYTEEEYSSLPLCIRESIESNFNILDSKNKKDIWKNPRFGIKTVHKLIDNGDVEGFINTNPLYRKNFERNKQLILDDYIPESIVTECISAYESQKAKSAGISSKNTKAFKDYLTQNGLSQFAETLPFNFVSGIISIEDFL